MARRLPTVTPRKSEEDLVIEGRIRAYVRQYMAERRIDQVRMAERLHVAQGTVSRILSTDRGIGFSMALKISRVIRVALPLLLEEDPPEQYWDADAYAARRRGE